MHRCLQPFLRPLRLTCLALALLVTTLAVPLAVTQAASAPPASPFTYLVQPEVGQGALLQHGYFWLTVTPGQHRTVRLVVKNTGVMPLHVRNYAVDSIQKAASGIDYSTWRTPLAGVGTWMRLSPTQMTLAPGQARRVTATIRVPRTVQAGAYVGGVAVEDEQVQTQGRGTHVLIDVHYRRVIAAVLVAPGLLRTAAQVGGVALAPAAVGSQAVVTLRNSGNALLKGAGMVAVQGHGLRAVTAPFMLNTVLPAARSRVPVPLPLPRLRLQPGTYTVRVRLRSSAGAALLAWHGSVVVAQRAVPSPQPHAPIMPIQALTHPAQGIPILAWALVAVVTLLLGVGLGVVMGRRAAGGRSD